MQTKAKADGDGSRALVRAAQPTAEDLRQAVAAQTTEALKAELARLLGFTAENLLRLALVVNELEGRGEDLSHLKIGLLPILRQIGSGKLLSEAAVAFAGRPADIKRLAAMPLEEQRQVVARGFLPAPERKPVVNRNQYTDWGRDEEEHGIPAVRNIARQGSEKDVAGMVVELVMGGDRPLGVLRETLLMLRDYKERRDIPLGQRKQAEADLAALKRAVNAALVLLAGK